MSTWLRSIVGTLILTFLFAGGACPQGPPPAEQPSPSKSAAGAATAAPSGGASGAAVAKPTAAPDWKTEWEKTLAAAKKEGKLVLAGPRGATYRDAIMTFQKAFPDIQLEYAALEGGDFAPKVIAEREGEKYLWGVFVGGATTGLTILRPKGIIDSL